MTGLTTDVARGVRGRFQRVACALCVARGPYSRIPASPLHRSRQTPTHSSASRTTRSYGRLVSTYARCRVRGTVRTNRCNRGTGRIDPCTVSITAASFCSGTPRVKRDPWECHMCRPCCISPSPRWRPSVSPMWRAHPRGLRANADEPQKCKHVTTRAIAPRSCVDRRRRTEPTFVL